MQVQRVGWAPDRCVTRPFVGCLTMSSRWDSLDDMAAWWAETAQQLRADGALHDMAVKSGAPLNRLLCSDVFEAGTFVGSYVAVTRARITNPSSDGFLHAAGLMMGPVATAHDAFMADEQFLRHARDNGVDRISTTYFQVLSRMP